MSESLGNKSLGSHRSIGVKATARGVFQALLFAALLMAIVPACHQPMRRAKDANKLKVTSDKDKTDKGTKEKDASQESCKAKLAAITAVTKGDPATRKNVHSAEFPPVIINGALARHFTVLSKLPAEGETAERTVLASVFVGADNCKTIAILESPLVELTSIKDAACDLSGTLADGSTAPPRVLIRSYDEKFPSPYEETFNHKLLEVFGVTPAKDSDAAEKAEDTVTLILFQKNAETCQSFLGRVDRPLHAERSK